MNHLSSKPSGWSRILLTPCFVLLQALAVWPLLASASDLKINGYQLLAQDRVGRTTYDYTFKATLSNPGVVAYSGATASIASVPPHTTIIDGSLSFGEMAIGESRESSDTFKIRVDRLYPFTDTALTWTIGASLAAPTTHLETAARTSSVIGVAGGQVVTTSAYGITYTLSVEPGALATPSEISLTPISLMQGLPLTGQVLAAVRLEPEDLRFSKPATLVVDMPVAIAATRQLAGFTVKQDGSGYWLIAAEVEVARVKLPILHFSIAGILELLDERDRTQVRNAIWARYFGPNGVRDALDNAFDTLTSCRGAGFMDLANDVFAFVKMVEVVPNLDLCGDDKGTHICTTPFDLGEEARNTLTVLLANTFFQADRACTTDPAKEVEVIGCLAAARDGDDVLIKLGLEPLDVALDKVKTCGLWSLELRPTEACLGVGEIATFQAIAKDRQGNLLPGRELKWSIDGGSVTALTVIDQTAKATANVKGRSWLTVGDALSNAVGYTGYVVSVPIDVEYTVKVTPSHASLAVCSEKQLSVTVTGCGGRPVPQCAPLWYSNDVGVAGVDATGFVSPRNRGRATISATCGEVVGTADIVVKDFRGTWEDEYQETLKIVAQGTQLHGAFSSYWDFCGGTVRGTVDGQVSGRGCTLDGVWADNGGAVLNEDGSAFKCLVHESGTFRFSLSTDGNSFTGFFDVLCFGSSCAKPGFNWGSGTWNATRRPNSSP